MLIKNVVKGFLTILFLFLSIEEASTCSMYKLTFNGKTIVGNNEDSWRLTSRLWFEQGNEGNYGAAYVGYSDKPFPDGAVNEFGLAFDGFTVPGRTLTAWNSKKTKASLNTMKTVMQKCKTVEDVYSMLDQYNLSALNGSMLLFVDKTGKYLVVEADTMTMGNNQKYVLSNFCPSQTPDLSKVTQQRYLKGVAFLKNKIDTSVSFCRALSDTMSVCRSKIGDGTLYTTIYDLNDGIIYLYFYHDFSHQLKFNIKEELAKGDHVLDIPSMFPGNKEYAKLKNYKIPQNSKPIKLFIISCMGLFLFSALFFLINFFATGKRVDKTKPTYVYLKLLLFPVSLVLLYYMTVLMNNDALFYFPAPYRDYKFSLLNVAAYIPILLLILYLPLLNLNYKLIRQKTWDLFSTSLLTCNNIAYTALLILFTYWGFYSFF